MKECITHHHACDCREAKFEKLQQELDAARADAKKNQIILDNLRDAPYWEIEKQLAEAKAQIAEYEGALNQLADCELGQYIGEDFILFAENIAEEVLNKWSVK